MAERPIFVPKPDSPELVKEIFFELKWNPGFAAVQKEKNIKSLHAAAAAAGFAPLLEISTKSENKRGRHMSAFHMTVPTKDYGRIKLELAFQGGKVFENGWNRRRCSTTGYIARFCQGTATGHANFMTMQDSRTLSSTRIDLSTARLARPHCS